MVSETLRPERDGVRHGIGLTDHITDRVSSSVSCL